MWLPFNENTHIPLPSASLQGTHEITMCTNKHGLSPHRIYQLLTFRSPLLDSIGYEKWLLNESEILQYHALKSDHILFTSFVAIIWHTARD